MPTLVQFLYIIAFTLAPPGTHNITVSSGNESYHWNVDHRTSDYFSSQLEPDCKIRGTTPEHPIVNNDVIPGNFTSNENTAALIHAHDWDRHHILMFDDNHQLEKDPGGYVYSVHLGSNSQKIYSITYRP